MENKTFPTMIEANVESIEATFKKIRDFATSNNYVIEGELKHPTNMLGIKKTLSFDSRKQMKVVRNFINRFNERVSIGQANRFLHFLFRKIYKTDGAVPKVKFSEKQIKIQATRDAWKKMRDEAEKARVAYVTEKGDFFKTK